MIGQTVLHYKILEKLGEGGMGVVYKAQDTKLDRTVALKFLPDSLTPTEKDRQRFIREAKSAAALKHPNICTIYSVDEYEDRQFISMEYINGETLRAKVDAGEMSLKSALDYGTQIANALAKAHQNNIIHRDIKPENIMIDEDGHIKVMDFGLAKLKQDRDITKTGDMVGTLAYMSPEQIRGQQVDHRSDIFSLGIVLYEMLTSNKPFQGEHLAAITYSIANEEPTPLKTYLPDAPEELIQIFDQLLAKAPKDRLESATEAKKQLENIRDLSAKLSKQSSQAQTESEAAAQNTSSSSTTLSITGPNFGFGNKFGGKSSLLVIAVLTLILFVGWWLIEGNANQIYEAAPQKTTETSVAVLPFEDISPKGDQQWFSDGLTAEILNSLAHISELRVPARSSTFLFRDTKLPATQIADSLNVTHLVEGSVRRVNNQMRITAQLIRAKDGSHIWSDTYNASTDSVFKVQLDIAKQIVSTLDIYLDEEQRKQMFAIGTRNVKAYEAYLKGLKIYYNAHDNWQLKQLWDANKWFERASQLDSTFAAPYFDHSDPYVHILTGDLQNTADTLSLKKAYEQMRSDLNSAIQHEENPEVQLFYRFVLEYLSPSWNQLPSLISQIQNNTEAHEIYARRGAAWIEMLPAFGYAAFFHQLQEARIKQDPLNDLTKLFSALALISLEKNAQAQRILESISTFQPGSIEHWSSLAHKNITKKQRDFWANITPSETNFPGFAKGWRLIAGVDKMNREELNTYIKRQDTAKETVFVSFAAGFPDITNQLAQKIDDQFMGSNKLSSLIWQLGSHIPFDLANTPNLNRQFKEAGIETETDTLAGREVQRIVQRNIEHKE